MTHDMWMTLLSPVITTGIIAASGAATAAITGVSGRLKTYLDVRGQAQASQILTDATTRLQAGMLNSAGQIALKVQAGQLDVTDGAALRAEAVAQAAALVVKLPQAIATAQPVAGALVDGILGKLGTLAAAAAPIGPIAPAAPAGDASIRITP